MKREYGAFLCNFFRLIIKYFLPVLFSTKNNEIRNRTTKFFTVEIPSLFSILLICWSIFFVFVFSINATYEILVFLATKWNKSFIFPLSWKLRNILLVSTKI